jgi:hypothetical protein
MRLDLLRGFCVVVMVADHIGGEQSWLYVMTGGNRFFTSAAEGFVMRYGMVRLRAVEWKVRVSIVPTMLRPDPWLTVLAAVGDAIRIRVKIAAATLAMTPFPPTASPVLRREGKEAVSARG